MVEIIQTSGMNRFKGLSQLGPILGETQPIVPIIEGISPPEQVFEDLWTSLTKARIARTTLAKRKISPAWFKTPQKLKDVIEEILEGSKQIGGYVVLPSKLPALRINTARERIEAGVQVYPVITQRLQAYAQMQYEARYGNYANGLGQIIKESTAQVITTFSGTHEPEIQQALNQQILVYGKEQISEIRRSWLDDEVPKHDGLVKLIVSRLYRFWGPANIPWEAAFQAGRIGLADALGRYDPSKGSIGAFANKRISGAVFDLIRSEAGGSRNDNRDKGRVDNAEGGIIAETGIVPTTEELALVTGISVQRITRLRQLPITVRISDLPERMLERMIDGAQILLVDPDLLARPEDHLLEKEYAEERQHLIDSLYAAIALLPPRYAAVIRSYYLEGAKMEEIGLRLDITESRVSQLHTKALSRLRTLMTEGSSLKSFLKTLRIDYSLFYRQGLGDGLKIKRGRSGAQLGPIEMLTIKQRVEEYQEKASEKREKRRKRTQKRKKAAITS